MFAKGLLLEAAHARSHRSTRLAPVVAGASVVRKMANISTEDPIRQVRFDNVTRRLLCAVRKLS